MFSSCLICHAELGRNEVIEALPVGERLAFEPATGRVWVICLECGEWNLAPIDQRWEAVEQCNDAYDASHQRASTDGVAVAKVGKIELVRLGEEAGSELITLRYGDRLLRRQRRANRRKWVAGFAHVAVASLSAWAGAMLAGPAGIAIGFFVGHMAFGIGSNIPNPVVARVRNDDGEWIEIRRRQLKNIRLVPIGESRWSMRIDAKTSLRGSVAVEAARYILPLYNRRGQSADDIRKARNYVKRKGGTVDSVFAAAARRRGRRRMSRLSTLDPHIRLALEVLASEESELQALSSGLKQLEQSWQHASELAVIQDGLAYGPGIARRLARLAR